MTNQSNTSLSLVLEQLFKISGTTEAVLSRAIKLPRSTINRIKTGIITDPKASTLEKIANYFCVSVDQLLGRHPISSVMSTPIVKVPLVELSKLYDITMNRNAEFNLVAHNDWVSLEYAGISAHLFACKVIGEAMSPYLEEQSILIVDTSKIAQNRNFVAVYLKESDEVIVRTLLMDGKTQILQAMNDMFPNIKLTNNDHILGVVIHVKQDLYTQG